MHGFENLFGVYNVDKILCRFDLIECTKIAHEHIDCISNNVKKVFLDTEERADYIR